MAQSEEEENRVWWELFGREVASFGERWISKKPLASLQMCQLRSTPTVFHTLISMINCWRRVVWRLDEQDY